MIAKLKILALMLVGTLHVATAAAASAVSAGRVVAFELEVIENTVDGCEDCGCRIKGLLDAGKQGHWWITFGAVKPHAANGWQARDASSHCGSGSFDTSSGDFRRTVGIPYVVLDLATTTVVAPEQQPRVTAVLTLRTLTGFAAPGRPTYTTSTRTTTLPLASEADATLVLFVPDKRERDAFGVDEVLLRLRALPLAGPPAAYGAISVTADEPGAEILLDGGVVGRVAEGGPTVLRNVLVGRREIVVRDFSGREARIHVRVEEGKTVEAALKVLSLDPLGATGALAPIGKNAQGYDEHWRVRDGAIVVRIPAGEFLMGSSEAEGQPDERPQRRVYVSEFLIDKTEVTWRQMRKFAASSGRPIPPAPIWGSADDYSAANLTWDEAQAYCEWVGGRLPTEAEWEKAARGTDGRRYPWGDAWDPTRCNSISGGPHRAEPFGAFPGCQSPYGVLDMSGSIWEWCADWYGADYYTQGPSRDPKGPASGTARVLRGGDWISQPLWVRAAYRFKVPPTSRNASHGFRCAQDTPR
jgi:formylglycine-generating enzyme required for sulfatase activity